MAFIEIESISKTFRTDTSARHVLDDVTLTIEQGEFVSIVGFMGCGKSTLLSIVAGFVPADAGEVRFGGELMRGVRHDASVVFQNYSLLPWLSALENVRLAVRAAFPTWSRARQREQAQRHLDAVGLGQASSRRPGQLSGGMRQRVAIARAFAIEPEILLLDNPFGALDALTRESLQQELVRLSSTAHRPVTTLMITNNIDEALLLSDRIIPMTRGPRATLGLAVTVELEKPRTAAQLLHDVRATRARAHTIESLTEGLEEARRRHHGQPRELALRHTDPRRAGLPDRPAAAASPAIGLAPAGSDT